MAPMSSQGAREVLTREVLIGDGFGSGADLLAAAQDAAKQALVPLRGQRPDLVCVFVSGANPTVVEEALLAVADVVDAATIIGCDAGGVLAAGAAREGEDAVAVWAAVLPGARVRAFHLEVMRVEDNLTVLGLPSAMADDRVGLMLVDPWTFPVDGFVDWSHEVLSGLPIVGGVASGSRGRRGATRLLIDGRIHQRGAVGVLIGGDVEVETLVSQGCRPIGPPMTVTRSEGQVVHDIALQSALQRATEVVDALPEEERALAVRGLHLGVALDEYQAEHEHGDFLIRSIIGANHDEGSITVGDVVEIGSTVAFHLRDADAAHDDLERMLSNYRAQQSAPTAGALLLTCNGRGRALFTESSHDGNAVRAGLQTDSVAGFFAAGEIGPVGDRNYLHGFTATVLVFPSRSVVSG